MIRTIYLVIILIISACNSLFSSEPWARLAFEHEGFVNSKSFVVDRALYAFRCNDTE